MLVGGVQAKIYIQQRDNQKEANKQALFDRKFGIYLTFREYLGNAPTSTATKPELGVRVEHAVLLSEHLFRKPTYLYLKSLSEKGEAYLLMKRNLGNGFMADGDRRDYETKLLLKHAEMQNALDGLSKSFREMSLVDTSAK